MRDLLTIKPVARRHLRVFYLLGLLCLPAVSTAVRAADAPPAPAVTVVLPKLQTIVEWAEFTGRFEAVNRVDIRARISGYLQAIHFEEGQLVQQGDLLFEIDPRPHEAAVAEARAALTRAESQLTLADLDLQRGERLLKKNAISTEDVDTRRASRQVATANVAAARALLRTAELNLDYTRIRAPISGRISSRRVDLGNLIAAGEEAQALTSIVSLDPLHFVFDTSEAEYLQFARLRGTAGTLEDNRIVTELHLLDETEWTHTGHLDFIDNAINQNTGTMRMRAVFDNPDHLLLPGIFGRLRLPASKPFEALLIPDAAVVADQSAKVVMTVDADNKVVAKPVQLGPLHDGLRVVRSGLEAADRVIVKGLLRARPGTTVNAEMQAEAAAGQQP